MFVLPFEKLPTYIEPKVLEFLWDKRIFRPKLTFAIEIQTYGGNNF